MKKLNFSILTAGYIADWMAQTVSKMDEVNCRAIAARDLSRAEAMAQKYGFEAAYGAYEDVAHDSQTDLIYIGSLHPDHYTHAKMCLENGKHVMLEKPFTINRSQAEELIDFAVSKNLFIMEAVWTRFMPALKKAQELIVTGEIGDLQMVNACFTQLLTKIPRLVTWEMGGGALLDLGIYPLTFAAMFLGANVESVRSSAIIKDRIDWQGSYALTYPGGKIASLSCSLNAVSENSAYIGGDQGYIMIDGRFWEPQAIHLYKTERGEKQTFTFPHEISGYEYEVRAAVVAIQAGKLECEEMPHAETLRMMGLMDAMRAEWGVKYSCEL